MRGYLCLLLLGVSLALGAQRADNRASQYLNDGELFRLDGLYRTESESLSPFFRAYSKAMLGYYFNRPDWLDAGVEEVLKNHWEELDAGNLGTLATLRGYSLRDRGLYGEAADVMQAVCERLRGRANETALESFRQMERQYRALSRFAPYRHKGWKQEVAVPMRLDTVSVMEGCQIRLSGRLNGQARDILFDTGAGANVMSFEMARACKLRMLGVHVSASGIAAGSGYLGIADSLTLGGATFYDVPFYVLNLLTGDAKADRYLSKLGVILGSEWLKRVGEVTLDFVRGRMILPVRGTVPVGKVVPNLCFDGYGTLVCNAAVNRQACRLAFDTGSVGTYFNAGFYRKNKSWIDKTGVKDTLRMGGFGGVAQLEALKLRQVMLRVGPTVFPINGCLVATSENGAVHLRNFGTLGMDAFRTFKRITVSTAAMYLQLEPYPASPEKRKKGK